MTICCDFCHYSDMEDQNKRRLGIITASVGMIILFAWITVLFVRFVQKAILRPSLPLILYFVAIIIVEIALSALLLIFTKSNNPWAHFWMAILGGLLTAISILNFVTYTFAKNTLVYTYKHLWTNDNMQQYGITIEDKFDCCGYDDTTYALSSNTSRCYFFVQKQNSCSVKLLNFFFNQWNLITGITLNVLAIIAFLMFVIIELGRIDFDRADYDKLQLRPIQDF